jgi:hypothetical protein
MKTFGRIAVATAATLALALAPVGIALAQSTASAPRDHGTDVSITLDGTQRVAVLTARSAYITTATGIKKTYHDSVEGILATARTTTASAQLSYEIAKDAYAFTRATGGDATAAKTAFENAAAAYKAALQSARTTAQPKLDAARTTARDSLEAAGNTYIASVKTAVPNAPAALLVPPGRGKSWISHGFGKDYGMGWGHGMHS